MTPTKAERAASDARDAELAAKLDVAPPPLTKEERADLPTTSTDPAFTGKAVTATAATQSLRHITHPRTGRRLTTEELLMRLPVGSIVARVEAGIELRRRDGNSFKHGAGATLALAIRDITGVDPSALDGEARKQHDLAQVDVRAEQAKAQQTAIETRRAEIAELAKVVAPGGPSIVRTEVGDRPAMVGSDFTSDDIEHASEFGDGEEDISEQPETDSEEEEGLPNLADLPAQLQTLTTVAALDAQRRTDKRKGAKPMYAARRAELKDAEA